MAISNKFLELQLLKYNLFKAQDPEVGRYDVVFELDGQLLYAHKNCLNLVSDTFEAMLSDRWTNKDEPIKIEDYTFDEFYEFLTFLYSAQCQLTLENISSMVDIAEFYNVALLKSYCEEFLLELAATSDNIFSLLGLAYDYSLDDLKTTVHEFITDNFSTFVSLGDFLDLEKHVVEEVVVKNKDKVGAEELFEAVYKWAEIQAMDISADENFNLNDSIKAKTADFLPLFEFEKMDMYFLLEFLVPRGFIFPSLDEMSKILCSRYPSTKIKITNSFGHVVHGKLFRDKVLIENLKSLKNEPGHSDSHYGSWWGPDFGFPTKPSPLEVNEDIDWYLLYNIDGYVGIKRRVDLCIRDYLIAEMTAEPGQTWIGTNNSFMEVYQDF